MKKRFQATQLDKNNEIWIHDMKSGAGVVRVEPNHDWFWVDKEVDENWDEQEYVTKIAETIVEALNKAEIPKPNI